MLNNDNNILIIVSLLFTSLLSYLSYKLGKNKKENEILKNNKKANDKLKKEYDKVKINSNSNLINKLSKKHNF